jgi:Holliday junction DNA helicase RuvA
VIARLHGILAEVGAGFAVIDVGGVGYLVHLSQLTQSSLPARGEKVALRTYTHVREDALDLFGFASEEEEAVFRALIDVKGVGPRAAQNILSGIEARELAQAVAAGDVVRLTKVPGIGKKTAERLVVELRDKLAALAKVGGGPARPVAEADALEQLRTALVNLGYRPPQAEGAVESLRDEADGRPLDELLREALKRLRG